MENRIARKSQSFGIILECLGPPKKYLICKRRDSYAYGNLLRGKWNTEKELRNVLALLEPEERERIKKYSFHDLWSDYWTDHDSHAYTRDYSILEEKYTRANPGSIVDDVPIDPDRKSLWGFPKGRANNNEDHMEAALRECCEETRLDKHDITFKSDVYIKEKMLGTDQNIYHITYFSAIYFGKIASPPNIIIGEDRIRPTSFSEEISEIKWVTSEEAISYLDFEKNKHLLDIEITLKERSIDRDEYSNFERQSTQKYFSGYPKTGRKFYHYASRYSRNDN